MAYLSDYTRREDGSYIIKFSAGYTGVVARSEGKWLGRIYDREQNEISSHRGRLLVDAQRDIINAASAIKTPVHNARFGGEVMESITTPWSCSVASESYWQN